MVKVGNSGILLVAETPRDRQQLALAADEAILTYRLKVSERRQKDDILELDISWENVDEYKNL